MDKDAKSATEINELTIDWDDVQALDPEALAYSRCVTALDAIPRDAKRDSGLYPFLFPDIRDLPPTDRIQRVLLSLSERFDADLVRKPAPPPEPVHDCNCEYCDD